MDKRIFLGAAIIILLAGAILGYNLMNSGCEPFEIKVEPANPRVGDEVRFTSLSEETENITWNFGNGKSGQGVNVSHVFTGDGKFTVTASLSENCSGAVEVTVLPKREMETVTPEVSIPATLITDESIVFSDNTREASSWTWSIAETGETGDEREFRTTFKKPGTYTLALTVKGEYINGVGNYTLKVEKAKPAPKPVVIPPRPKPEPVAVRPKPEPKPAPAPPPVQKPVSVPVTKPVTPAPASSKYFSDDKFADDFISIANALGAEDNNSSSDWKSKIVSQAGESEKITILLIVGKGEPVPITLESFKNKQILNTYNISQVRDIKRRPDKSISQITVVATKK